MSTRSASPPKETAGHSTPPPAAIAAAPAADDDVNPLDFDGNVDTDQSLPTPATLRKIDDYLVLDRDGKSHTFRSLYTGAHKARRVLVVFVRHFFCGPTPSPPSPQLPTLAFPPALLLSLPIPTTIVVIGCGDPALIPMYASASAPLPSSRAAQEEGSGECPYPIFADPSTRLYDELGMIRTLALGPRPAYTEQHILLSSATSIIQGLKTLHRGLAMKGGNSKQVGGEFLFEPAEGVRSPLLQQGEIWGEEGKARSETTSLDGKGDMGGGVDGGGVDKIVTWCHRMRNTRDHVEVEELKVVLGVKGDGVEGGK
ncbi:hypothetical protein C8A05DRAFT_16348 [Staphylotrichum tortipilum]|uniref:Uncharacterized protein n=1 Tax=Staphylotrichum tortipilum TaxID=2831512 RepID=A0AAN6RT23_9PEZI|nr:hypothetical protein C8A05DRAFT_16348 [Staphylotrichum longicolle]